MNIKKYFSKLPIPDLEPVLYIILLVLIVIGSASSYVAWLNKESIAGNIAVESFSLIFTIFIVDHLNQRRSLQELKKRLIRQMGSHDNGLALNAFAELEAQGWLNQLNLFNDAWLRKANLKGIVAYNVDFSGSQLEEANFTSADLTGATFKIVDLRLVTFDKAMLVGATFKADMIKASFKEAYLQKAIFNECTLTGADFSNANLQGAIFNNCKVDNIVLTGAIYNRDTQFPPGIDPKKLGARLVKDIIPVINQKYL